MTEPALPTDAATAPRADGLPDARHAPRRPPSAPPLDLARRIVELAEDKKAADIVLLDLARPDDAGRLLRHLLGRLGAAARRDRRRHHRRRCATRRSKPIGREGTAASHWVLLDFGSVIVHIFTPPERDYYQLEKHWSEAKTDPPRAVAARAVADAVPAAVPLGHVSATAYLASGQVVDRAVDASPEHPPMSAPARSLPRLRPPAHHDPVRHDVPAARPERAAVLRHPGRPVRGLLTSSTSTPT